MYVRLPRYGWLGVSVSVLDLRIQRIGIGVAELHTGGAQHDFHSKPLAIYAQRSSSSKRISQLFEARSTTVMFGAGFIFSSSSLAENHYLASTSWIKPSVVFSFVRH